MAPVIKARGFLVTVRKNIFWKNTINKPHFGFAICSLHFHTGVPRKNTTIENHGITTSNSGAGETRKEIDKKKSDHAYNQYRDVMSKVPSAVVVVTASSHDDLNQCWVKRGVTCSSFTSVSMNPPIVSFCMHNPSRMHTLMLESQRFAVNILAADQVHYAVRFSKNIENSKDQFENIYHAPGMYNIPLLRGAAGHVECRACSVHSVGDHHVWYGHVTSTTAHPGREPLLYYARTFRSVGDEVFIKAFEERTLLFEDWTHEAHLRMAWNYIREYGKDRATPLIKEGIKKYNEVNKERISRGYNDTVTVFYIHMIAHAMQCHPAPPPPYETFDTFIRDHPTLRDDRLLFHYYTTARISLPQAVLSFVPPDLKELP